MAIYQFVIELIPKAWFEKNKNKIFELLYDTEGYNTSIAWDVDWETKSIEQALSVMLPLKKSWHEDLTVWGDEERSDINLWKKNGGIESIRIRFDLRDNVELLKASIVSFSEKFPCVFFIPETKEIINPDLAALNLAISKSNAQKFVKNPRSIFDNTE